MKQKQVKIAVVVLAVLYLLYTFHASFTTPKHSAATEFHSNTAKKLREHERHTNWKLYGFQFSPNNRAQLPKITTVRQQLAFQFPYEPEKPFERNIWQTWKVDLELENFPSKYRKFQQTWLDVNPTYKHHVIPDEACEELVNQLFSVVPDVARAYNIMPKSILKADFFRYLILFARGGVYSDIDTVSLKPIDVWMSANETLYGKPNNPGLVVGIEADPDRDDWADWYARRIQFCQWTIQAKKGHPMLREIVALITEITLEREKKNQLHKVLGKDEGGDVMVWTGPGIWTDSVFAYMNNALQSPENFAAKKYDEIVTWKTFTGMKMPIAIDDVLVLPITSFSPDVNQMGAKSLKDPMAYAKHMFAGSWKPEDER